MLPTIITLALRILFSDFLRYVAVGLAAIYVLLPISASPFAFACIVTGVTICVWSAISLTVWTAPNTFRMQCFLGQRRAVVAVMAA
jgi:hypothetical protein